MSLLLHFIDKVVDVLVVQVLVAPQVVDVLAVAVHRQGVDVPVILQGLEIPLVQFLDGCRHARKKMKERERKCKKLKEIERN